MAEFNDLLFNPSKKCTDVSYFKSLDERLAAYEGSVKDPQGFWATVAKDFHWNKPWDTVLDFNYHRSKGKVFQRWFDGATTNVCYNALDRHLKDHGNQVAFHWEGNDVGETRAITYNDLYDEVTRMCGVLREQFGVVKGTAVSVYLPMEGIVPVVLLALARIGALCNVVFAGFSAESLAARMLDCQSPLLITADGTFRGDKPIKLKQIADEALRLCAEGGLSAKCLVYLRHSEEGVPMIPYRDFWYHQEVKCAKPDDSIEWVESEHPLFMLYTSGSTGKPKGLVHTTGGYMVYAATTFKHVFDYHPDKGDVHFCTADIGWITGHTYVVWGPLLQRATSVLFEGIPTHPTAARWWELVEKYKVTQFYTAPTAIRALMKYGEDPVRKASRSSLRVVATVGEPINVTAWEWYYEVVGEKEADLCDTWFQTETGAIMITPLPGCTPMKPSSASLPFFGIMPAIINQECAELEGATEGLLCMKYPWPGQARTIYGDHERYEQTYFNYDGYYFSGDGCRRDKDGYYWLTGRVDDVLNVSGHRLGTSEIEAAINKHPNVIESAVIGFPHDIKGEGIYAYVTFKEGVQYDSVLLGEVKAIVRKIIGPLATPDCVVPAPGLPKTRSGKIMRRILRKIAVNEFSALGDVTTLADPSVVEVLIDMHHKWGPHAKK